MKDKIESIAQYLNHLDREVKKNYVTFAAFAFAMIVYGIVTDLRWSLMGLMILIYDGYLIWENSKSMSGEVVELRGEIVEINNHMGFKELRLREADDSIKIVIAPSSMKNKRMRQGFLHVQCIRHMNQSTGKSVYTIVKELK